MRNLLEAILFLSNKSIATTDQLEIILAIARMSNRDFIVRALDSMSAHMLFNEVTILS